MTLTQRHPLAVLRAELPIFLMALIAGAIVTAGARAALSIGGPPGGPQQDAAAVAFASDEHEGHDNDMDKEEDAGEDGKEKPAHDQDGKTPAGKPVKGLLVDLGNTACPVMGGDVDGKTYTEWNGLRIGHCCPGCSKPLLKDPEKVLDDAGIEWRKAAAAVKKVNDAKGDDRTKALTALRKTWKVVREPAPEKPAGVLLDLGNTACPVMGGDVDGKTYTEWNGLRVGHCCPGCSKPLLENPEQILDDAGIAWRKAAAAVKEIDGSKGDARKEALAAARKKWTVVREPAPEKAKPKQEQPAEDANDGEDADADDAGHEGHE